MSDSRVDPGAMVAIGTEAPSGLRTKLARSPLRTRMVLLAAAQFLVVVLAGVLAKVFYIDIYLGKPQAMYYYAAPIFLLSFSIFIYFESTGLDNIDALTAPSIGFGRVFAVVSIAFLVLLGVLYTFKTAEFYSRGWFLCWYMLSVVFLIATRWAIMQNLRNHANARRFVARTALFGTLEHAEKIKSWLQESSPFVEISGVYLASKDGKDGVGDGGLSELIAASRQNNFDKIIISMPPTETEGVRQAVKALASGNAELLLCSNLEPVSIPVHGVRTLGKLKAEVVAPVPLAQRNFLLKRFVDIAFAGVALTVLLPLFLAVALAIKLESKGPVFFRQRRYGRNSSIFRIFKFRSMTVTEDGAHIPQARPNDARVTRVGRIIRSTSIDELPQLINVLKGDMSLVGPRPHAIAHDDQFEQQLDLFSRRRRVLPGITGWAQVHGFRGETRTLDDIRQRMEHDLYYIDNWSIWLDLEILFRTVVTVFRGAH